MKIIPASYEIIEDQLAAMTIPERLEACGRICYKSEDRITPGSAEKFVQMCAAHGHWSVFEMATKHYFVHRILDRHDFGPYITAERYASGMYVTGSVRALFERFRIDGVMDLDQMAQGHWNCQVDIVQPEDIPNISRRHRHQRVAVRFAVNRAVSHELVRHRPVSFLQESQRYCRYGEDVTFIRPCFFDPADEHHYRFSLWGEAMANAEEAYHRLLEAGASPQAARTVLPNSTKTEIIVYCSLEQWRHMLRLRTSSGADPSMREVMGPLAADMKERWGVMI